MKNYRIEVVADARPIILDPCIVQASNVGSAIGKGYRMAKKRIRHGSVTISVKATYIKSVKSNMIYEEAS